MANPLYLRGVSYNLTRASAVTAVVSMVGVYIVRETVGGLFDVYRLGPTPLYNGQHAFIVKPTDVIQATEVAE